MHNNNNGHSLQAKIIDYIINISEGILLKETMKERKVMHVIHNWALSFSICFSSKREIVRNEMDFLMKEIGQLRRMQWSSYNFHYLFCHEHYWFNSIYLYQLHLYFHVKAPCHLYRG